MDHITIFIATVISIIIVTFIINLCIIIPIFFPRGKMSPCPARAYSARTGRSSRHGTYALWMAYC